MAGEIRVRETPGQAAAWAEEHSHGGRQFQIGLRLTQRLPHDKAAVEIGVQTSDNVKVPDVAWSTQERCLRPVRPHELP